MTSTTQNLDDRPGDHSQPPAGDDLLPPVEPPSAKFIIQLFVVPALIVAVILGVWLTINSLVRRTSPEKLIQGLESGPSIARWQRASDLAFMLSNKRYAEVRQNPTAAAIVARTLDREIDRAASPGGMEENEIQFRYYLTRALGQFDVQEGTDALLKAAQTKRDPAEWLVCYSAIQALARRIQLDPTQAANRPELQSTLLKLAGDEDPSIRSATAYALGKLSTPAAIEQLEVMVDDPDPETRYNAAVALAHHGNARAVETLAEMLDLEEMANGQQEADSQTRALHRSMTVQTAMTAAEELARQNPDADLSPVIDALERLAGADAESLAKAQLPPQAVPAARAALKALRPDGD